MPNEQSSHTLWATSPPGSTFKARHIITNRVVSSFESLLTNKPLGGVLVDDMGLGNTIQANALIGTSKEQLIEIPHLASSPAGNKKFSSMLRLEHCKPKPTMAPLVAHYLRPTS
ncbi:hypothetical protein O181_105544 [Austropuccinia psidii MF-1]|uniref:SNF2 N-terminal domain-containing protein n=1 Tax=Austropuccinia psidii MF-1 TaxID=1389203 RepID=A0A9Q3JPL0_9BASI|nr:hypothetical protein [Austropuccinia psidii MF-1]